MEHSPLFTADGRLRILLLEDSDIDAELIETHLQAGNFEFDLVRVDERAAFEGALGTSPDIVLADFALPSFDGMTALSITLETAPATPFIFVSGVIGEEFATRALQNGATDYVTKRNLRRLPVAVRRAVEQASERRRRLGVEAALKETEQRFRLMADHAPALIWACDENGRLSFVNRRFEVDFGLDSALLLAKGMGQLVHPDDRQVYAESFGASFAARTTFSAELRALSPSHGVRWMKCEATPRFDAVGRFVGYVGCAVDVTESRLAADELEARVRQRTSELQRAEEALRQSQKMEAIGQLTGGIAHDFNNMLAGIIGSLSVVKRRINSQRFDDIDRFIDGAIASGKRAAALTQRLLAFSRRQSLDVKPTDINAALSVVDELLRRTLGENIQLALDLQPGLWPALTDANQFDSAILNLAINARDAMPAGGTVSIATINVEMAEAAKEAAGQLTPGRYVKVSISDDGAGMPEDVKARAFDPFFTTKPIGQGTGLGLSMIYGFVKQTGGHVTIDSEVGRGTRVTLYLQQAANPVAEPESAAAPTEQAHAGETVLVVEDDPSVRMLILEVLHELGYKAIDAVDAQAAMPLIDSNRRIDLLVSDVGLPGMNGRQLAELARQKRPLLPVLFVTGYAEQAAFRGGFLARGMQLMSKPFEMDALGTKIREMLGAGEKASG